MKPILKNNPKHKKYVPPVGEHTVFLKNGFWLFHVDGYLVVSVTFEQKEDCYRDLYVTLENGKKIPLEWTRIDRRGKRHTETTDYQKGVSPLLKDNSIIPGKLPVSVVTSTTLDSFNPENANAPEKGFFWINLDCDMASEPNRAILAQKVAATKPESTRWDAYWVYKKRLVSTEELADLDWDNWKKLIRKREDEHHKRMCSNPGGTDGWR